ncbi:hypothetical protein EV714DRAFT_234438 [Schizophyllum commune]
MPREGTNTTVRRARQRIEGARALEAVRHHTKRKTLKASHSKDKQPRPKAEPRPLSEFEELYRTCTVPGHVPTDLTSPEFAAASARMRQALNGTLPEGAEAPVYASHYSYMQNHAIPQGTAIQPGAPVTSHKGQERLVNWSEEMVDASHMAEFGSVELGRKFMRVLSEKADVIGGTPRPDDPSIRDIPIPGRTYHIRLWTGCLDRTRLVCWNFMDNKTGKPRLRPSNLRIYSYDDGDKIRLASIEEGCCFDLKKSQWPEGTTETFCADDGSIVDFVVGKTTLLRLQLPARPFAGPPRIKKYSEYKILPIEDDEDSEGADDDGEEAS